MKQAEIAACLIGIIVGGIVTSFVLPDTHSHSHDHHPIADPTDDEYHVHADFLIYIEDRQLDLSGDQYMTTATQELSEHAHLHDNNGDVKHIHAEEITFTEFLKSLSIEVTDQCITESDGTETCVTENTALRLYVNNEDKTNKLTTYVPVDDDRILLYLGPLDNENLTTYLESIPHDSCYYSGTCPERGTAPPESCGLTCEL